MGKIIAVFRSKKDTVVYFQKMQSVGVKVRNRSIPPFLKMPCGICVEFDKIDYPIATSVLKKGNYSTFVGFYPI